MWPGSNQIWAAQQLANTFFDSNPDPAPFAARSQANWNPCIGPIAMLMADYVNDTNGYCKEMMTHLITCCLFLLKIHKHIVHERVLSDFKADLLAQRGIWFNWQHHREEFRMYQRTSNHLRLFVHGMNGIWKPLHDLGLLIVLHAKIPVFQPNLKKLDYHC